MHKQITLAVILVLASCSIFGGCSTPAPQKFSSELVNVYAELLLLHEKEKIVGMIPDSLYRLKVKDFFEARKIDEGDFQKQINEISRDDAAWRDFLNKATVALDSIKAVRQASH
ncbi:MAG: hypothetical protein WBW71_03505 [Bacteroidota bacterium]